MAKLKGCLWVIVAAFLVTAISPLAYAVSGEPGSLVSTVSVQIKTPAGSKVPAKVEDRLKDSVSKVAGKLLVGQEISAVQETRSDICQLIRTVFGKILQGYEILDVKLTVGEKTVILLDLQPTGVLIEQVNLNLQVSGIDDKMIQVLQNETANLSRQMEVYLLGLPVSAFSWAEEVVQPLLYVLLADQFPGFTPTVNIAVGSEVKVDVHLVPYGPQVRHVDVQVSTHSLPQSLIYPIALRAEKELEMLRGLPLALLEKQRGKIIQMVEDIIHSGTWGKFIYPGSKPQLVIGPNTSLVIDLEWTDLEIGFLGELNIGADAPEPALHLSLGKRVGPDTTVIIKDRIALNKLQGTVSAGIENYMGAGITAKLDYELKSGKWNAAMDWRHKKYGITFTQPCPGEIREVRLALNYYPFSHSQVSLIYTDERVWLTFLQSL